VLAAGGAAILSEFPGLSWLVTAAASLGVLEYNLTQLCLTDPPAMPTFTAADVVALLIADAGQAGHDARQKVVDTVARLLWGPSCLCTTGPQPAAPALPANPGATSYQPQTPTVSPCYTFTYTDTFALGAGSLNRAGMNLPIGAAPTSLARHIQSAPGSGVIGGQWTWKFDQRDVSNVSIRSDTFSVLQTTNFDTVVAAGTGVRSVVLTQGPQVSGTGTQTITGTRTDFYCNGGAPGQIQTPCCPPDPSTTATLSALLALVTLIQRQIAPFGYVPGTAHAGLTGTGQFTVSGILGLSVNLTTTPARVGETYGDPVQLFDVGWVNVGSADGFGPRHLISSDPFIIRPVAGDVTLVGYSIPADVVVTITELVREP
jgi:hypothetical protein